MAKMISILNVVAWSGFWAFGFLAVTSGPDASTQTVMAILLSALGGAMGMWAYFWLVRYSETTGYAKPRNRATIDQEEAV